MLFVLASWNVGLLPLWLNRFARFWASDSTNWGTITWVTSQQFASVVNWSVCPVGEAPNNGWMAERSGVTCWNSFDTKDDSPHIFRKCRVNKPKVVPASFHLEAEWRCAGNVRRAGFFFRMGMPDNSLVETYPAKPSMDTGWYSKLRPLPWCYSLLR